MSVLESLNKMSMEDITEEKIKEVNGVIRDKMYEWSILRYCSYKGNLDLIKFLIEDLKWDPFDDTNTDGWNVLHFAVFFGNYEMSKFFLEKYPKLYVKDRYGYSPLYWCVFNKREDIIKLLINEGVKRDKYDFFENEIRETVTDRYDRHDRRHNRYDIYESYENKMGISYPPYIDINLYDSSIALGLLTYDCINRDNYIQYKVMVEYLKVLNSYKEYISDVILNVDRLIKKRYTISFSVNILILSKIFFLKELEILKILKNGGPD